MRRFDSETTTILQRQDDESTRTGPSIAIERNALRVVTCMRNAPMPEEASCTTVQYIPRQDVDMALLECTHPRHLLCPYKGKCSYHSVPVGVARTANAVWTYEHPYDAVAWIKNQVAFRPERVEVIEELDHRHPLNAICRRHLAGGQWFDALKENENVCCE